MKSRRSNAKRKDHLDPRVRATNARRVLGDARFAARELDEAVVGGNLQIGRIRWVTCLTLLRAVGHVLEKRDAQKSNWLERSIAANYNDLKDHRFQHLIYWQFIVEERNILIKEYEPSIIDRHDEEGYALTNVLVGDRFFTPTQAVRTAVTWWERNLATVEERAAADLHNDQLKKKIMRLGG